jgi:hypothetical protein
MATLESSLPVGARGFVARHVGAVVKFAVSLLCGAVVAYGAAQYQQATRDARITHNENRIDSIEREIVPRKEHEAHWEAMERSEGAIQTQLRDVQRTQTEILLRLTK